MLIWPIRTKISATSETSIYLVLDCGVEGRQESGARREKKETRTKISDSFIDEREQNYKTREIGLSPRCDREWRVCVDMSLALAWFRSSNSRGVNVVFTTTLALQLGGIKYNHNKINCGPKFCTIERSFLILDVILINSWPRLYPMMMVSTLVMGEE